MNGCDRGMRYGLDLRTRDYLIEHSAEGRTIDRPWLHGEADDAAGELIHQKNMNRLMALAKA